MGGGEVLHMYRYLYITYRISGYFRVSQNLRKCEKCVAFLIMSVIFCHLKSFLLKMIQNIISAHSIICDLKEIANKVKIRSS